MSMNAVNTTTVSKKTNLAGEIGTSIAMSGAFTGGFGSFSSIKANGGIRKAISATKANNAALKQYADVCGNDVFTRSLRTAANYNEYTQHAKEVARLEKAVKKNKLSIWARIGNKNPFQKTKTSTESIAKNLESAKKNLNNSNSLLKQGADLTLDAALYSGNKGFVQNAKTLFGAELKNKFVLGITVLCAIPRIKDEVIPAFKNEGFFAGIKATGKAIARTGMDFISNAGFSAIGRAFGTVAGGIFGPVGCAIGGTVGDIVGSFFSMKFTDKIFNKDKTEDAQENSPVENESFSDAALAQNADNQNVENNQIQTAVSSQDVQTLKSSTADINKNTSKYEGMTSRYKGPRPQKSNFAVIG